MSAKSIKPTAMLAEFIGTFGFAFAILASLNGASAGLSTPVVAALTLGILVLSIGMISGAHVNPAITLGALSVKKIDRSNAAAYIVAQFSGALLAWVVIKMFVGDEIVTLEFSENSWPVFFAELLGTAIFGFGIAAAIHHKLEKLVAAALIAISLLIGIIWAQIAANGLLNPAIAASVESFNWSYILGPVAGSIIGMNLYAAGLTKKGRL